MLGVKIRQIQTSEWREILAKDDSNRLPQNNPHSYRKLFHWQIRSKLRTPQGTSRETASALYQLKIGHGYLKSYLYRLNHAENDRCRCGRKETPEHLLLSCPEVGDARKHMRDSLSLFNNLTAQILLHSTIGIAA